VIRNEGMAGMVDEQARRTWLDERRAAVRADYDATASTYDDDLYPATSHRSFVERLLATCPPGGVVLDAPCGTGRWFDVVHASGRRVVGIDQSAGMLAVARSKGIAERLELVGLQELPFAGEFDAAMSIDAFENVPPEEWPLVVSNLHRSIRAGGHLYLTVEEVGEADIDTALAANQAAGVPAVRGEIVEGDTAGYHYYPGREQAIRWLEADGFGLVDEGFDQEDGWGYRHLLLRDR
jgi:SAM-dependent methyltransferase